MRKNKKHSTIILALLSFATVLAVSTLSTVIVSAVNAVYTINKTPAFTVTVGSNVFTCYRISGVGNESKVAVGWGKNPTDTPDTLNIPATLTNAAESKPYNVVAIARGGFSRCDFKYINLPESIEEMREGCFAYCGELLNIRIPHLVETISASSFTDCRKLKTIMYSEKISDDPETYASTTSNEVIKRVEDHAFDSCVSLIQFECPKSLVYIGKSAFQNCSSLTRFYLPDKPADYDSETDAVTIDSYAFADCSKLEWVYFEENLVSVKKYAFVDCKSEMVFHYAYTGATRDNPEFEPYWRRKSLKQDNEDVYPFDTETHAIIRTADGYQGLKVGIEYTAKYLDSFNYGSTDKNSNTIQIVPATAHAVIYQWDNPGADIQKSGDDFFYYKTAPGKTNGQNGSGILTIPATVTCEGVTADVKVISPEAFKNCTVLKEIHFNKSRIVQIQKNAFKGCTYIDTIDFENVTTLKEISRDIFGQATMEKFTGLIKLPACLEYLGPFAFYQFVNATGISFTVDSTDPKIKVIGNNAFKNIAIGTRSTPTNYFDLVLPCSLNDADAKTANMNSTGYNWAAISSNSFSSKAIKTVTMAPCGHAGHSSVNTSIAKNAFDGCVAMTRFTANANLCKIGSSAFNNCTDLKEMFLTTTKANNFSKNDSKKKNVWGTDNDGCTAGTSIFGAGAFPNLVIYLDGDTPKYLDSDTTGDTSGKIRWNSEEISKGTFANGLGFASTEQQRSIIPTYTNVNFSNIHKDSLIYFDVPASGSITSRSTSPVSTADYFAGILTCVKVGNKYTVAHYYVNASNAREEFGVTDLKNLTHTYSDTTVNVGANLTTIGAEAFASDRTNSSAAEAQAPCPGKYFVLPSTITTIEERAFYRKAVPDDADPSEYADYFTANATAIVTTDDSGALGGAGDTYANIKSGFATNKYGYCNIPNITSIGNDAFFNNSFKTVDLGFEITYFGRSAFYSRYGSQIDTISFATPGAGQSNNFAVINYGIYYVGNSGAKKTLLYQAQNDVSGLSDDVNQLTIDSGTIAVGPAAVTNTAYTKVDLNGVKYIYGSSFQNNPSLTEVEGDSSLEYIGSFPYKKTAVKIEKYKYFIGLGSATYKPHSDCTPYGHVYGGPSDNGIGVVSTGPSITVNYIDENGVGNTLWPFEFSGGSRGNITLWASKQTLDADTFINWLPSYNGSIMEDETDFLDSSLPMGLIDHRDTLNPDYSNAKNRTASFQDNTSLTRVNFEDMTNLLKIGKGAFMNCTNLTNVNSGTTYRYYSYNSKTHRVSTPTTTEKNVLDLSKCTRLISIGQGAFYGCTQIQYAHLPFTDGGLFVQKDPQEPISNGSEKVFSSNNIKILLGDTEIWANYATHGGSRGGLTNHYPTGWENGNTIYYYAKGNGEKDIYKTQKSIHYWTQNLTKDADGYILFNNYDEIDDYFKNIATVEANWPSLS